MEKKRFEAERQGYYSSVVMQPSVVNENNVPSHNVASERLSIEDTQKLDGMKIKSVFGTDENPWPEISLSEPYYNSETGVILQKIDSFDFDNREDGK